MLLEKKPKDAEGHNWVFFTLLNGRQRAISLEELYYILQWIGECEDEKYPEYYHKGRQMPIEFLTAAINKTATYKELASQYQLPTSKGTRDLRQESLF